MKKNLLKISCHNSDDKKRTKEMIFNETIFYFIYTAFDRLVNADKF